MVTTDRQDQILGNDICVICKLTGAH
jgi:hypothetical protein